MATRTARLLKRLRTDFQLSVITLTGLFGVIGITPYAIYRLATGNYLVGTADTIIVLSAILAVSYAWITRDTIRPGLYMVAVLSVGATLIAIDLGVNGLFWIYPMILFNFFMVTPGKALLATSLVLASLSGHALWIPGSVFESRYQMVSFLVTALMTSVLSLIFAMRTRSQRDQLQLLAIHDPLTGARNRRALNDELKIAMAGHSRHGISYGLLLMDLDHFKQVNDRFGHHVGDQVLVAFVDLIKRSSRQEDRLFRFGGEEFLLLLPNTGVEGLHTVARHLLEQVKQTLSSPGGAVTVSIGGAILQNDEHWENWLQRADACLYRAKSEGRDRVVINEAAPPSADQFT
ncbi:diguanylate cyclase [Pseudomonas sp. NCCP-436]|uniref:GGDEF domain-containing protein n=1 Tax=Pseudomonas sp. NCCP-436 TaxID=2842481 RepID=UPI001C7F2B8F|nr:GGDEF domain-containing protein [Pseudomonas sp. NCCP-436]GIZ13682.1 GGDEF domain-containing protein [Pseudomonas sp. NCCP-436]